jgi:hypothetical protein
MLLELSTRLNPLSKDRLLVLRQWLLKITRRHDHVRIVRFDPRDQFTVVDTFRIDNAFQPDRSIKPKVGLSLLCIRAVACEAMI